MYLPRPKAKDYLEAVEWATPKCFIILGAGKYTTRGTVPIRVDLCKMSQMGAIRKLSQRRREAVYASVNSKRYDVGCGNRFDHDVRLRECLAKYFHDHAIDLKFLKLENDKHADAYFNDGKTRLYFEFDNGNEDEAQLREKFQKYYKDEGKYRVIFFMASRYNQEQSRLDKLFNIVEGEMKGLTGRILGACYSQYLENGKVYNLRGEAC